MRKKRKIIAYVLSMALMLTSLPIQLFAQVTNDLPTPMAVIVDTQTTTHGAIQINPAKYVGDGYEILIQEIDKDDTWINREIHITNTLDKSIKDWNLEFDFNDEIVQFINADIVSHEGNHYIIQKRGYNSNIEPGQTITLGFRSSKTNLNGFSGNYKLNLDIQNDSTNNVYEEKILTYSQNVINLNEYTFNGHTYSIIKEAMLWPDAKVYCENLGGHLVTISSKEENAFIQSILVENKLNSYTAIGYSDAEKEGEWKWVTGEDSVYTNWDLSWPEPNNGVWLGVQNYAFMISNGTWDDGFLDTKAIFICEWDKESKPELTLEVDGATKLEIIKNAQNIDQYLPNPFTITANIKNISLETVTNANVTLDLPKGMEVVEGQKLVNIGDIPVGTKQYQVSWKVKVEPSAVDKVEEYGVILVADNAEAKTLKREITIPKLQTSQLKLFLDRSSIRDGNTIDLRFKIVNNGKESVDLSKISLKYYFLDESPKTLKSMNCYDANIPLPYIGVKDKVKMKCVQNLSPQGNAANAYILFYFDQVMPQLEAGQELLVTAGIYNQNGTVLNNKNDYSYLGNNEIVTSGYEEWKYITMYEGEEQKKLIWGVEPSQVDRMQIEGTRFEGGQLNSWATNNSSFDVTFNEIEASRDGNNIQLKGNILYNDKSIKTEFIGTLVEEEDGTFGDRIYVLLDDNSQFDVLSCSIEKDASYIWLQDKNSDLNGKNVFRISLLDKSTNNILDMEGEWKLGENMLENVETADTNDSLKVADMKLWFTDYTPIYDLGIFNSTDVVQIQNDSQTYKSRETKMLKTLDNWNDATSYTTSNGKVINLGEGSKSLFEFVNPDFIANEKGYRCVTYKDGDYVKIGKESKQASSNGGCFYYITEYYTGVKYIEILSWSVEDDFADGLAPYNIRLHINFCESYIYAPIRDRMGDPNAHKNMLYSCDKADFFPNQQTKLSIGSISVYQEIYSKSSNFIPIFSEQAIRYNGQKKTGENKFFILTRAVIDEIPLFDKIVNAYEFFNEKKEIIDQLTEEQYEDTKTEERPYVLSWKQYIENLAGQPYHKNYVRGVYVPEVQKDMLINANDDLTLRNSGNGYQVEGNYKVLYLSDPQLVNIQQQKSSSEIIKSIKDAYVISNSDIPRNKFGLNYKIMFKVYAENGNGISKPFVYECVNQKVDFIE